MSDRSNPFTLPPGMTMPKKFARSWTKQAWFTQGAHDAINGRPMADQKEIMQDEGAGVWDAYWLGYQEGQKYKAQQKREG